MQTETNKKWYVGVVKTEYGMQSKKTFRFFLLENYIFLYKFNLVKDNYIILLTLIIQLLYQNLLVMLEIVYENILLRKYSVTLLL